MDQGTRRTVSKLTATTDGIRLVLWSDGDVELGGRRIATISGPARMWIDDAALYGSVLVPDFLRVLVKARTPGEAHERMAAKMSANTIACIVQREAWDRGAGRSS